MGGGRDAAFPHWESCPALRKMWWWSTGCGVCHVTQSSLSACDHAVLNASEEQTLALFTALSSSRTSVWHRAPVAKAAVEELLTPHEAQQGCKSCTGSPWPEEAVLLYKPLRSHSHPFSPCATSQQHLCWICAAKEAG